MDGSASIFKSGFFYVTIGLITLISVILAVNMFLIVDSQLDKMIEDMITAMDPKEEIVPMHTENPEGFLNLNISKELKRKIRIHKKDESKK